MFLIFCLVLTSLCVLIGLIVFKTAETENKMDLDDFISDFSALKVSALSKAMQIKQNVDKVTLGPNATLSSPTKTTSPRIITAPIKSPTSKDTTTMIKSRSVGIKYSPNNHSVQDQILSNLEKNRREMEQKLIDTHHKNMENFNKQQAARRMQQLRHQQALKLQEIQYQENLIMNAMQQVEVESKAEFARTSANNKQRQEEAYQLLKAKAEETRRHEKLCADYTIIEQEIVSIIKEIDALMKNNQEARSEVMTFETEFKQICTNYKNISTKIRTMKIQPNDLQTANELLKSSKEMKQRMKSKIKAHYEKRQQEAAEKVAMLKMKEEEARAQKAAKEAAQITPQVQSLQALPTPAISEDCVKNFVVLQTFLHSHQQSYKQLLEDQSCKQFKFDCKKAVNIPVNAISAVSSEHLRDKYIKLHTLLSGKTVVISDSRITASQHPQGIAFVMDLLAQKFVLQGDLTISSNPEAAFAYATIIVTLWNDFPTFGKLLLAHFYKECPYLVPIYFHQQEGQTDEEFYTSMGYQYKDGVIEKQDKFLKRMTGISKLYFAILISHTKRGTLENPHNIARGWTWFARILNREPYVDITATVIYSFLEVAGVSMQETYRMQFKKLINYIVEHQLPLLKEKDSGGPLVRLEVMLQDYYKTGVLPRSAGILSANFW